MHNRPAAVMRKLHQHVSLAQPARLCMGTNVTFTGLYRLDSRCTIAGTEHYYLFMYLTYLHATRLSLSRLSLQPVITALRL